MKHTSTSIGDFIKATRKSLGVTQRQLASTAGTGIRFIIELEQGKPTCQLEKTLKVMRTLGINIQLFPPIMSEQKQWSLFPKTDD